MSGPIALHGGGEFQPGDEPFLRRLLEVALASRGRARPADPLRIAIVPTAAARGRPDLVGAHGTAAFERVAASRGVAGRLDPDPVEVVEVLDAASAADPGARRPPRRGRPHPPAGRRPGPRSRRSCRGRAAWDAIARGPRPRRRPRPERAPARWRLASRTWTPGGWLAGPRARPGPRRRRRTRTGRRWAGASAPIGAGAPRRARAARPRRADRRDLATGRRAVPTGLDLGRRRRGRGPLARRRRPAPRAVASAGERLTPSDGQLS